MVPVRRAKTDTQEKVRTCIHSMTSMNRLIMKSIRQACRKEVKRLKELITNYPEEVQPMSLNCEICGTPIDSHYGELTISIQPHVIKDGSFWKIDKYVPDVLKRKVLCEACIIRMKHDIPYDVDDLYTWGQIWMFIKQKAIVWWTNLRRSIRS